MKNILDRGNKIGTHMGRRSPPWGTEGSVVAGAHRLCMFVREYRRERSKRRVGSQVNGL